MSSASATAWSRSSTARWRSPTASSCPPDGTTLYVGAFGNHAIVKYTVAPDGTPGSRTTFAGVRTPDGATVNCAGNVYWASYEDGLVHVFSPAGVELGTIPAGRNTTNAAFGGPDGRTLYITSGIAGGGFGLYQVPQPAGQPLLTGSPGFTRFGQDPGALDDATAPYAPPRCSPPRELGWGAPGRTMRPARCSRSGVFAGQVVVSRRSTAGWPRRCRSTGAPRNRGRCRSCSCPGTGRCAG
ncbi:SMP-30/gluconolactonase/LRE family protein [Saccharothrix isguenensis]